MAVRAAVLERHRRAVLAASEHQRLAEDHAAERLALHIFLGGGDIPVVSEKHGVLLIGC